MLPFAKVEGSHESPGIFSCRMRPLGWMSTCLSGPVPVLTNLWGTPAGATTIWPAPASIVAAATGEGGAVSPPKRPGPGFDDLVGHPRRRPHDLAGARLYRGVADGEGGLALQRQEELLVGGGGQHRPRAGGARPQEGR